jgi:hypothetical protein
MLSSSLMSVVVKATPAAGQENPRLVILRGRFLKIQKSLVEDHPVFSKVPGSLQEAVGKEVVLYQS